MMSKPPTDIAPNVQRGRFPPHFDMAKLTEKTPLKGTTIMVSRASPSWVNGRSTPAKSGAASKLPRRKFGQAGNTDSNLNGISKVSPNSSSGNVPGAASRDGKRSPSSTRTTPDKPLPGLPVARIVTGSPDKQNRSLIDAAEQPLRVSPGTPQETEWPALSPEKSPHTEAKQDTDKESPHSQTSGGSTINRIPRKPVNPSTSTPVSSTAAISKLINTPGVTITPPSRKSSLSSSSTTSLISRSPYLKWSNRSNESIKSASSVTVPLPSAWPRPKMVNIEGRGPPAAAAGAVRPDTPGRRNLSPARQLSHAAGSSGTPSSLSRSSQIPVSRLPSSTTSPTYKPIVGAPNRRGAITRTDTSSSRSTNGLPRTPPVGMPGSFQQPEYGTDISDIEPLDEGPTTTKATSNDAVQGGARVRRLSAFAHPDDLGPKLTIFAEAEEVLMGTGSSKDAVPPPVRMGSTASTLNSIRKVSNTSDGPLPPTPEFPEVPEEEIRDESEPFHLEHLLDTPSARSRAMTVQSKFEEPTMDASEMPAGNYSAKAHDHSSALSLLEGTHPCYQKKGDEFDITKLGDVLRINSQASGQTFGTRSSKPANPDQADTGDITNASSDSEIANNEGPVLARPRRPTHTRRPTPLSWPVLPEDSEPEPTSPPVPPKDYAGQAASSPTTAAAMSAVNSAETTSSVSTPRTIVPSTVASNARSTLETQFSNGTVPQNTPNDGTRQSKESNSGPAQNNNQRTSMMTDSKASSKRSASRGHLMPKFRSLFKKNGPKMPSLPTEAPEPPRRAPVTPGNSSIPQLAASSNLTRPTAASRARNAATPTSALRRPRPQQVATQQPSPPAPAPAPESPGTTQIAESTALVRVLMERAREVSDNSTRDAMLSMAQVMVNGITSAANAERSMVEAAQAAHEARMSYQLTQAAIAEMNRLIGRSRFLGRR